MSERVSQLRFPGGRSCRRVHRVSCTARTRRRGHAHSSPDHVVVVHGTSGIVIYVIRATTRKSGTAASRQARRQMTQRRQHNTVLERGLPAPGMLGFRPVTAPAFLVGRGKWIHPKMEVGPLGARCSKAGAGRRRRRHQGGRRRGSSPEAGKTRCTHPLRRRLPRLARLMASEMHPLVSSCGERVQGALRQGNSGIWKRPRDETWSKARARRGPSTSWRLWYRQLWRLRRRACKLLKIW
mmetsp:Transcript_62731/g.178146  ORF Transcript_62731/g.178146 Transcript_62731/m.178146 type:complete len:239 (-) Transcript_62731:1245-1961(-)